MKIKICVNSTKNYSEKTLPIIIPSLIYSGIDPEDIFVFEGGHHERSVIKTDSHTLIQTDNNTIDFTGLIDIVENELKSDYWFYVHDTCKVGPKFKKLLYNIPRIRPDKIAIKYIYSMNIGSYKYEYLLKHKNRILQIKNKDYSEDAIQKCKLWGVYAEDYMLHQLTDSKTYRYNPDVISEPLVIDEKNWYGTETKRITEYYPNLDLYKSKSNYNGPQKLMEINL